MKIQFVFLALRLALGMAQQDNLSCTPDTYTDYDTRRCYTECGIDHPGGDYKKLRAQTLDECGAACGLDNECVTAQYHAKAKFCYLKTTLNPGKKVAGVNSIVCKRTPCTIGSDCYGDIGVIFCGKDPDPSRANCFCAEGTSGQVVCADGQTLCSQAPQCDLDSDCGPSFVCVTRSCCFGGICVATGDKCPNLRTLKYNDPPPQGGDRSRIMSSAGKQLYSSGWR